MQNGDFMKIVILDKKSMGDDISTAPLEAFGEVVVYGSTSAQELFPRIADAEVIVLNKVKITKEAFSAAKKLRLVCEFATGFDNIDLAAARENGVAVTNVPGYSTESVALYTMATVLSLFTHMREYNDYVKDGSYTASGVPNLLTPVYHELAGKTWGIVGCGNIGRRVAEIANAFGCKVIVNKRTPVEDLTCVDIETLCKESDIITVHCPLNDGTRHLINKNTLSLMKPTAVLYNAARGAVLNEADVADAVLEGKLGAFGSDVYSAEPMPEDHPFQKIKNEKNVLLTPHAAWAAVEARERCLSIICENIKSFLAGERKNRVD